MKKFLIVTAFLEGATGLALMIAPAQVIKLLLGSPLTDVISIIVTKVGGSALVSIAIICWLLRNNDCVSRLKFALLFYNCASIALFGFAYLHENLNGIGLWPAIVSHILMAVWCLKLLINTKK